MADERLTGITAGDRMSRDLLTVAPDHDLRRTRESMVARRIRHVPVVAEGRLVGVVTDRDIREAIIAEVREAHSFLAMVHVSEVMTTQVVTVTPQTPIGAAAQLLLERKIGCLPVVEGEVVVGILTESDIFRAFMEVLGLLPPAEAG